MSYTNASVAGKLALVTGAASGIGKATCQILSREGATIIGIDTNFDGVQETVQSLNDYSDHSPIRCDVSSSMSVRSALDIIINKYKRPPTIIVNSAGIVRGNEFLDITEKDYDDVLATNLKGTFLVTQIFAKALVEAKLPGSIINIASITGRDGQIGFLDYAASKAAVINLSKTAAHELGKYNIRVNAVLPGIIDTPFLATVSKEVVNDYPIPLGRLGKPKEVGELITFLASDISSYMTGGEIEITGGH